MQDENTTETNSVDDLTDDFLNPEILKFAKVVAEKDKDRAQVLRTTYRRREHVNNKAKELIEEKGAELCSSMMAVMAEEHDEIAAITEMGWAVNQFVGIGTAFNRMAEMTIGMRNLEREFEIDYDKAIMFRAFAIVAVKWGVPHVESSSFDEFIRPLYAVRIGLPDDDMWDQAYARLQLENAELEVLWNENQAAENFIKESEDDDELD